MTQEEKINELMGMVIDVACYGIAYGSASEEKMSEALSDLNKAEAAVERKLREIFGERPEQEDAE
jgi:hypothetical protein